MSRDRVFASAIAALAAAGVVLVAVGSGTGGATPRPSPDGAAEAHAAAGVTTGPEVAAAFDDRVAELERRVEAAPDDRAAVLELARLLHDGHRTREAIPRYWRAIELDRADPVPYYDLSAALGELGQWGQAREILLARLEVAPDDATALYDLGVVEINAGDEAAAISWWERAREAAAGDAGLGARIDDALTRVRRAPEPGPPRSR
jgi:tetratricopeptide (TPR) repeat protein